MCCNRSRLATQRQGILTLHFDCWAKVHKFKPGSSLTKWNNIGGHLSTAMSLCWINLIDDDDETVLRVFRLVCCCFIDHSQFLCCAATACCVDHADHNLMTRDSTMVPRFQVPMQKQTLSQDSLFPWQKSASPRPTCGTMESWPLEVSRLSNALHYMRSWRWFFNKARIK